MLVLEGEYNMKSPSIRLKEYLDEHDYNDIHSLAEICRKHDNVTLKLEIEYKLSLGSEKSGNINSINEFMYFDNEKLIGYLGICDFGGDTIEVNGMVHPQYRRQGIFKKLYSYVEAEWMNRDRKRMLLLSDHDSVSGLGFIKFTKAKQEHSEYEMYLIGEGKEYKTDKIVLRKAANSDAKEIARQNIIYFSDEINEEHSEYTDVPSKEEILLPEEEEKRGFTIYMALAQDKIIGKVHIELQGNAGGIYGLGVLPQYRGQGYGREILLQSIYKLKEKNAKSIMLQVATQNENALNLYKSCGFEKRSVMDYYVKTK